MSALRPRFFAALAPLAVASVLAGERPAQAVLTYYIYESGPDVVIETAGSLNLPFSPGFFFCPSIGGIDSANAVICTGPATLTNAYPLSISPTSFGTGTGFLAGDSATGLTTSLYGIGQLFAIDTGYTSGDPIVSSATFLSTTLNGLGITTTGLLGTWTLAGTGDTIEVRTGAPPAVVPGPLPLFGAAAAFGYSRRLRRRVSLSRSASQAATSISA